MHPTCLEAPKNMRAKLLWCSQASPALLGWSGGERRMVDRLWIICRLIIKAVETLLLKSIEVYIFLWGIYIFFGHWKEVSVHGWVTVTSTACGSCIKGAWVLPRKQVFFSLRCLFFPRKEVWAAPCCCRMLCGGGEISSMDSPKDVWLLGSAWVLLRTPTFTEKTPVEVAHLGLQATIKMLEATGLCDLCKESDWKETA